MAFLADPWTWLIIVSDGEPEAPAAPDQLSAAWDALAGNAAVVAGFGRSPDDRRGWLWRPGRRRIPDDIPYPRAALHWVAGTVTRESGGTATGDGEITVTVWAANEIQAEDLSDLIAEALEGQALRTTYAVAAGLWWTNADEPAELQEDPGPEGEDVYMRVLRFRVMTSEMRPLP